MKTEIENLITTLEQSEHALMQAITNYVEATKAFSNRSDSVVQSILSTYKIACSHCLNFGASHVVKNNDYETWVVCDDCMSSLSTQHERNV